MVVTSVWLFPIKNGEKFITELNKLPATIKKDASIMRAIQKMQKAAVDPELRAIIEYCEKSVFYIFEFTLLRNEIPN